MMYKNDFAKRYPEVCALEGTPAQRMRIAARIWELEPESVHAEYNTRYRLALAATGAKQPKGNAGRRKARSEDAKSSRRAKRAAEGAVLTSRSQLILSLFISGTRGKHLIRAVREWEDTAALRSHSRPEPVTRGMIDASEEKISVPGASPASIPGTSSVKSQTLPTLSVTIEPTAIVGAAEAALYMSKNTSPTTPGAFGLGLDLGWTSDAEGSIPSPTPTNATGGNWAEYPWQITDSAMQIVHPFRSSNTDVSSNYYSTALYPLYPGFDLFGLTPAYGPSLVGGIGLQSFWPPNSGVPPLATEYTVSSEISQSFPWPCSESVSFGYSY
ncbi:hypothetical protein BKA62DRAFT_822458 [Auriculariales sp. MPI-PUGE-AT-0066]|nr:hypothetical protein BKA62DRAFT_822458 [Auriculariales sp. MPI-PUGE-AT-0066]